MLRDLELFTPFPQYKPSTEWERKQCLEMQPTLDRLAMAKHTLQTLADMMEQEKGRTPLVDEYVKMIRDLDLTTIPV